MYLIALPQLVHFRILLIIVTNNITTKIDIALPISFKFILSSNFSFINVSFTFFLTMFLFVYILLFFLFLCIFHPTSLCHLLSFYFFILLFTIIFHLPIFYFAIPYHFSSFYFLFYYSWSFFTLSCFSLVSLYITLSTFLPKHKILFIKFYAI